MASLNKLMLIGRLTDNPEPPRTLPNSGSTVVKFRFAVGRSRKNPQTGQWENDPNPLYIDCEVYHRPDTRRNLCDVVSNYLRKGSQVYLEGRLVYETWEDKNGGGKRSKHKFVVEQLELLDRATSGGDDGAEGDGPLDRGGYGPSNRGGSPARGSNRPTPANDTDDEPQGDIPF